jgi:hypothetical protein
MKKTFLTIILTALITAGVLGLSTGYKVPSYIGCKVVDCYEETCG